MNWLIDTNVISELRKPKPAVVVINWLSELSIGKAFTSTMNIAELIYGANSVRDFLKKRELEQWVEAVVRPWFLGRIIEQTPNPKPQTPNPKY